MTAQLQWQDATSYRQGQRGKIAPTAWKVDIDDVMRVWICCDHIAYRGEWIMNIDHLGVQHLRVCPDDGRAPESVQREALDIAFKKVQEKQAELEAIATAFSAALS